MKPVFTWKNQVIASSQMSLGNPDRPSKITQMLASPRSGSLSAVTTPGGVLALLVFVVGSFGALSVDVPRTGFGIKGDEATYVAMALSLAHDGDLVWEAQDHERFYQAYGMGPEGIFLKRGATATYRFDPSFPFIRRETRKDDSPDRLYFGKAFVASLAASPFVRLAGLNGFLLFHVVLGAGMLWVGSRFLAARSPGGLSTGFTVAFFGASIVPLYTLWLTSETFMVATVFFAYFLWFYKEVAVDAEERPGRFLFGARSDIAAAVLLGLATFAKGPNVFLVFPPLVWALYQCRLRSCLLLGCISAAVAVGGFATNAAITGEFNHQSGLERRTFYGGTTNGFPFEAPNVPFEEKGASRTGQLPWESASSVFEEAVTLLWTNTWYFLVGRHFGFVPFFFPGVVAISLFFSNRRSGRLWEWAILGTVAFSALFLMVYMPYTWSGGGGPPGNRYFLPVYPTLFFIIPPLTSVLPALIATFGGMLFIAQILVNPFVAAKRPYLSVERGPLRWLPVELTMVNDLPIMNDAPRARVPHGNDPQLLLYYLDHNAYPPESPGFWVTAGRRADIIVRTDQRGLREVEATLLSRVENRVTLDFGGDRREVDLEANTPISLTMVPRGIYSRRSWAYLLTITARDGFVPRLVEPRSRDARYLGVAVTLNGAGASED